MPSMLLNIIGIARCLWSDFSSDAQSGHLRDWVEAVYRGSSKEKRGKMAMITGLCGAWEMVVCTWHDWYSSMGCCSSSGIFPSIRASSRWCQCSHPVEVHWALRVAIS